MKLISLISVGLIPFSLAAPPLIPTDCVNSSSDVKRNRSLNRIAITTTMNTGVGTGIPGIKPPIALMMELSTVGVAPPLIQYAMDRPHVYRIRVAIIGCILKIATRLPLNDPKIIATMQENANASSTVPTEIDDPAFSTFTNTLPAIAAAAPTLISCPPQAAVTIVMPMARITSSLAPLMIVMILPDRTALPSLL